jgi:HAD superfamily hydrolase (TIGR01490 family)
MRLALFDFDGTITTKDSMFEFIRYAVGTSRYYMGLILLAPMLSAYILKLIPSYRAKEMLLSYFFRGYSRDKFIDVATRYSLEQIDHIVRPKAIKKIRFHQDRGDRIIIVSASIECWLIGWCQSNHIELISTKLLFLDGKFSGRLEGKNCYGMEKVNRLNEIVDLDEFDHIYAYGDSLGDIEMLKISDESHYRPFR